MPSGVSVVIPAYQAASTIERSVASAIGQSRPPEQVIVVDDASTDDTSGLVERAFGRRVQVYRLPENVGAGAARNFGIGKASGKYVAFLDADDEWHPEKLAL